MRRQRNICWTTNNAKKAHTMNNELPLAAV